MMFSDRNKIEIAKAQTSSRCSNAMEIRRDARLIDLIYIKCPQPAKKQVSKKLYVKISLVGQTSCTTSSVEHGESYSAVSLIDKDTL